MLDINPSKEHPGRIKKTDKKKFLENLITIELNFPCKKKDFNKIELKNNIRIDVFGYENGLVFQFMFQIKNVKTQCICCF